MEVLNEMPRLWPVISDHSKYLWTKRQKLQQTASQICPGWAGDRGHDPKDAKQHVKHNSGMWRVKGVSNEKALRSETSRKELAFRPGCNLGSDMDCGRVG